jgi:hypothetical protein
MTTPDRGCGSLGSLPIRRFDEHPSWVWNGNLEQPTITPSIRRLDGCKFHGFLTDGVWSFCGDSGA